MTGRNTQVTTWRRYTVAEKKAYRARVARRRQGSWTLREMLIAHIEEITGHHFADNRGSRVPTIEPKGDVL